MIIGVLKAELLIDDAFSLKDKRQILKSLLGRIKARFNVSAAEVGNNELWKNASIGLTCVSNETAYADGILAKAVNFIENDTRVILVDYSTELIPF